VIIDKDTKVHLIDFERAKYSKKPSNLTQLLQFILSLKEKYLPEVSKDKIINLGKTYKTQPSKENFEKILKEVLR